MYHQLEAYELDIQMKDKSIHVCLDHLFLTYAPNVSTDETLNLNPDEN